MHMEILSGNQNLLALYKHGESETQCIVRSILIFMVGRGQTGHYVCNVPL
jgi:hypothetical protein